MSVQLFEQLFSLKGKTALVSGGYKGIGRLFADTYAEAGADVAIVARNLEACQKAAREISAKYGVRAIGKSMDVHKTDVVNRVVQEIEGEFKKIDILVNSAGVPGSEKPVLKMTDEDMDDVMNVDFRGLFLLSRAVAKGMAERKSGKIINISSVLGKISARNMAGYCSSKGAVIQLTRVMALELTRDNVQVNALCPGYFLTEFNREFFASDAGKGLIKKMIPMNRVGQLEELRSTALYLATCPAFLTGADIYVDGGHTIQ
ncbi:MAG: Gluconate 5-dehydrogenase [Smithella sp. PtaU1.Bin162]|nr:MAG: Gluconate 5-dehydrogenase [Smithella sp. PtaU1.Bin162]